MSRSHFFSMKTKTGTETISRKQLELDYEFLAEKVRRLEEANAALREDKARLDWLYCHSISRLDRVMVHCEHNRHISIREAIDAARKEAQP